MKAFLAVNLSFAAVENPEFCTLLNMLRYNVKIPNRRALKNAISVQSLEIQEKIRDILLLSGSKVSIALDAWTSTNNLGFLAIEGYFIDRDWSYRHCLLGFEEIIGDHTGENLQHIVQTVLQRYNIEHQLLAITVDNASNNGTLTTKLQEALTNTVSEFGRQQIYHVPCLAHVVQLSVNDFLKNIKATANENDSDAINDDELFRIRHIENGFYRTLSLVRTDRHN